MKPIENRLKRIDEPKSEARYSETRKSLNDGKQTAVTSLQSVFVSIAVIPTFERKSKSSEGTSKSERPSVREALRSIQTQQKKEADAQKIEDKAVQDKKPPQKTTQHMMHLKCPAAVLYRKRF